MRHKTRRSQRGTAIGLAIVVSVVVTGLIVAVSWVAGQQASSMNRLSKLDQAFFAAESGAQQVGWYLRNRQLSTPSTYTGSVNGYTYTTSWNWAGDAYNSITITSTASNGEVSYTLTETLTPPIYQPPALAAAINFDNKNIDVTGDMVTNSYDNGGSGSLTGNLSYYGTATNTGSVSGTTTHLSGSFVPLDFTAMATKLTAAAGATYNTDQNNKVFDFTAISGTNRVIVVNGNVSNPTFVGSGTLYVTGNITVSNFGASGNPVNLVAGGNVDSDNGTMYGSLYVGGTWSRKQFDLTGLLYAGGVIVKANSGKSSITETAAPWFDPRLDGSTSAGGARLKYNMRVSKFTGPQP